MAVVEGIFRGECKRIFFTPSADIACGTFVIVGGIVGVTTSAVAAGTQGELQIDGDYELQLGSAKTFVAGSMVLTNVSTISGSEKSGVPVGVALEGGTGLKKVKIKLMPFFIAQHAKAYSSAATYAVGDVVTNGSYFYVCKTAVSSAEAFSSGKWTQLTAAPSVLTNSP